MDGTNMNQQDNQQSETKSYTQDEFDAVLEERLVEEREKMQGEHKTEVEELKKNLKTMELRMDAFEQLQANGLPTSLVDALNCSDEDALKKSISILSGAFKQEEMDHKKSGNVSRGYAPSNGGVARRDPVRSAMGL